MKNVFSFLLVFVLGFNLLGGSILAAPSDATDISEKVEEAKKKSKGTGKGISIEKPDGFASDLGTVISGAINLVFMVAALIAFGFLIFGGIEWITSGGDKGKTEGARNKITAAVVGLLILAASWAIINFTLGLLGFSSITDVMNQDINLVGETKKK